ncbi:zinc finger protein 260-like [Nematolebias whitei]|uniref:zinc finger protein 260-like n=1 Tax=Nematolebias whitei TaxID=451745 RepID=UPI00189B3438|nr:zinc finger protein 260-like [Nematolebias whitei]
MWRQQVQQHLDAEEEEMEVFLGSRDALEQETTGGSQIIDAVFSPNDQLHIIVVPADVQKSVLIKEEAPEEQWPDVDQQNANCLHIKEEEEEQWTILGGEQLSMKEETDVTSFSLTAVHFKSEDDEEKPLFSQLHQHQVEVGDLPTSSSVVPTDDQKSVLIKEEAPEEQWPDVDQQDTNCLHIKEEEEEQWTILGGEQLSMKEETDVTSFSLTAVPFKSEDDDEKHLFSQLHQHQVEVRDLPTSSSGDHIESSTGEGEKDSKYPDLNAYRDSDSSETEVSEDDEDDNDVNNPESQLKLFSDFGLKTEHTDEARESSPSRVSESIVNRVHNKNGLKPFCCDVCGRRFNLNRCLNRHMKIHTGQKPFLCDLCEKRFTEKSNLKNHMKVHTGQKPFSCDLCEKRFTEKGSLKNHMKIHTGQKPFSCDVCGKRFTEKVCLKRHMRIHTGQKPFSCDLCEQRFIQKGHLNRHMKIHTGLKPFSCDLCEQRFIQKRHLNRHVKLHTGQKSFCCDQCEQRFIEKGDLNRHMKIHTEQKPFSCNLCEQSFIQKVHLNRHMMIHTGQKPFCCDQCSKKFTEKSSLKKHMMIHTRQKPLSSV